MAHLKVNGKLGAFLTKPQPIKVVIGGRDSGKSTGISDMAVFKMLTESIDVYCLREFQDSITESIHRSLASSITERLNLQGWDIQENKIVSPTGARTTYKGATRNPNSIQGAENYLLSIFSEAHTASKESLIKLIPTILRKPNAQCWFEANPQSSEDAFSKRFIVPYLDALDKFGVYEDDLHYIVVVNWRDNPWYDINGPAEKVRQYDFNNKPRAEYDWIWEGKFSDSIENGLIMPEWFDACIDAHVKLGIKPVGARMAAHDPSDTGPDTKGYAMRHGIVVQRVEEMTTGSVNEGAHWACQMANDDKVDSFTWDGDGIGAALAEQTARAFQGTGRVVAMFKGSESPDNPTAIHDPFDGQIIQDRKKVEDVFRNKRAQYYYSLRERIYRTYRTVEHKEYHDQDKLISFSSEIKLLSKLRAELCRMPVNHNNGAGRFELYTKEVMKSKFKMQSPNLGDSVMMLMRPVYRPAPQFVMPQPLPIMGGGSRRR